MTDFNSRTLGYKEYTEKYLSEMIAAACNEPQQKLYDAMQYSLMAGGKRLRPIFVYEFCRMCGGEWEKAVHFAAAIEMIHTYSLIHDDLPCMDNDDFRRGKLTSHKVFGEALAVLAGDALLTDAFAEAAKTELCDVQRYGLAISVLSRCAGSYGMVGGQVLDMLSEERACNEQEIIEIQSRKTGALIKAACVLGVVAGNGTHEQIAAAEGFAEALGMAFQIRDDMLDVIGNAQELGKATGVDSGKNTFVRLYGLDKCEELVNKYTSIAIEKLNSFRDTQYMEQMCHYLTDRTV
ncbi:MAG: polyprenyl synthetase family protein [Faecousia sp.]